MIFNSLTLTEMKLIEKCADLMIQSLTRIAEQSHPIFEDFYEAYKGEADNKLDIHFLIAEKIELWENIKEYPSQYLGEVENFDMLILRMVLSDGFTTGLNKSKKALVNKIDMILSLRPDNQSLN